MALAGVAVLLGGAALAVAERRGLAERLVLWQLRERGVAEASLVVERLDASGLVVRDLRLGAQGDLTLRALTLHYSPVELLAGRVAAARVSGLSVRGELGEDGLRLGALDALRGAGEGGAGGGRAAAAIPALPVGRLEVEDANVSLDTPTGGWGATFELALDETGDGSFELVTGELAALDSLGIAADAFTLAGAVSFRPDALAVETAPSPFALAFAGEDEPDPARIVGVLPTFTLRSGPGDRAPRIESRGGTVLLPRAGLEVHGLVVDAVLDPAQRLPRGSVRIEEIRDLERPRRLPPLALEGTFAPDAGGLTFEATLSDAPGRLVVRASGRHDLAAGRGEAELQLVPLPFGEGGTPLSELVPSVSQAYDSATGTLVGSGALYWGKDAPQGYLDLGVRDLALQTPAAALDRLYAALRVEGPWPPRVPRGQMLSMARLDFGLELTEGVVSYHLRPGGVLDLESATWKFAGGTVTTGGRIDLFADRQELLFAVDGVDLAKVLELVNLKGLSGTGTLGGRLPVVRRPGSIEIRDAVLASTAEGGWIYYQPDERAAGVASGAGYALQDLFSALENFRFERLTLQLDGDTSAELTVKMSLAGANPEYRDGQPYEFNLSVEGRLSDLLRDTQAAYHIPDVIEKRLEEISAGRGASKRVDAGGGGR